jgi:ribosomal protein S8
MENIHYLLNAIKTAALAKRKYAYVRYNKMFELVLHIFLKEGFILNFTREQLWIKVELNQRFPYRFLSSPYKAGNKHYFSRYQISSKYGWAILSSSKGLRVWPPHNNGGLVVCGIASHI